MCRNRFPTYMCFYQTAYVIALKTKRLSDVAPSAHELIDNCQSKRSRSSRSRQVIPNKVHLSIPELIGLFNDLIIVSWAPWKGIKWREKTLVVIIEQGQPSWFLVLGSSCARVCLLCGQGCVTPTLEVPFDLRSHVRVTRGVQCASWRCSRDLIRKSKYDDGIPESFLEIFILVLKMGSKEYFIATQRKLSNF